MLIVVLLKGVPARTTQAVQIGGVLNREAMELVLNPHDAKAVEAADFLKRKAGGKAVALTMGPDVKLVPLLKPLYRAEVLGLDEDYVLSDRRMAGGDTLATSYCVSLGVKKIVERHLQALDELAQAIRRGGYSELVKSTAARLYAENLLTNRIYSELPPVRETVVGNFLSGKVSAKAALEEVEREKARTSRFVVLAGVKTTDGETGSVGPQVAEGVSELMGVTLPHATYVEGFDIDVAGGTLTTHRRIGYLSQELEMRLPALMTIGPDYRPGATPAADMAEVRASSYRGKVYKPTKWTADDIGADPKKIGLVNSPTIVGSGVDVGAPPVQKKVGESLVFLKPVPKFDAGGKASGPFARGDLVPPLPDPVVADLRAQGAVGVFDLEMLAEELVR